MDENSPEYPSCDSPWHFYFNGVELPKWSSSWCAAPLLERVRLSMEDWDERIGWSDFWILYCRIDHVGIIESEDPLCFCVCAAVLLKVLLAEETSILSELIPFAQEQKTTAEEVYSNLRDALLQMLELTTHDRIAFWTTGYEPDRLRLVEAVRRHNLPASHSEYLEAPHVVRDREEALWRFTRLREDLDRLAFHRDLLQKVSPRIGDLPVWT
ncbi:MAG: hypothetical protein EOP84_03585 [Verrucomicrobiaceae bacterium]|nr:MAG: hypothetical protein EOP84_03585 [Verrucomicrobiaceae bacterium]